MANSCMNCLCYCGSAGKGISECRKHEICKGFIMTEENSYKCPAWTAIPKKSQVTSVFLRYDWHDSGRRIERPI